MPGALLSSRIAESCFLAFGNQGCVTRTSKGDSCSLQQARRQALQLQRTREECDDSTGVGSGRQALAMHREFTEHFEDGEDGVDSLSYTPGDCVIAWFSGLNIEISPALRQQGLVCAETGCTFDCILHINCRQDRHRLLLIWSEDLNFAADVSVQLVCSMSNFWHKDQMYRWASSRGSIVPFWQAEPLSGKANRVEEIAMKSPSLHCLFLGARHGQFKLIWMCGESVVLNNLVL